MPDSALISPGLSVQSSEILDSPRHSAIVRTSHWIHTVSFTALVVSGIAILLAHTRFYWGETGGEGAAPIIVLPLPLHRDTVSGWGRNLHFLSAWICVLNGLIYVVSGLLSRHFRNDLLPNRAALSWKSIAGVLSQHLRFKRPSEEQSRTYNVLQQWAYLTVVFLLFPLVILTGLAMSPAITSELPGLVRIVGGQQSARTIHFLLANFLMLFLVVHIAMVSFAGFTRRVRAMITGRAAPGTEL